MKSQVWCSHGGLSPTLDNAAESNGKALFFNKPWLLQRVDEQRDDLEFSDHLH